MEKGSIFSILACLRQNRNYGNNAKIKKRKNPLSCIILISYLTKYEPNRSTLKNQLEHATPDSYYSSIIINSFQNLYKQTEFFAIIKLTVNMANLSKPQNCLRGLGTMRQSLSFCYSIYQAHFS